MEYQIQIRTHNYNKESNIISKNITLDEIQKYTELIKIINKNANNVIWNWWNGLPELWSGSDYIVNIFSINEKFKENFGVEYDVNIIIDFYNKFTPNGTDDIYWIKIFKVEEIVL